MQNLLIATTNKGKVKELRELLSETDINISGLNEFEHISEPIENGKTFAENAELKATYYALKTNHWALADDSGLEVHALGNAPGIYSARYAGENATDEKNLNKLLKELKKTNTEKRFARFVCEMAISDKNGKIILNSKGICEGHISLKPFGKKGFGYDPIFIPKGYSQTFGQLSGDIKQQISHRSKAVKQIIQVLNEFRSS